MMREYHVRIWERLKGRFLGPTRLLILCKSKRSAERTLRNIIPFIENKLFLKVNKEKTNVSYISKIKFLGYTFYRYRGEGRLRAHSSSIQKMKQRLKELTSRSNGWGNARRKDALNQYVKGWVNYFKMADMRGLLKKLRLLVPSTSPNVHLETMETYSDEMEDVDKVWPEQI